MNPSWTLGCVLCGKRYAGLDPRMRCECGETLEVNHVFGDNIQPEIFDSRLGSRLPLDRSGVWRFRELILPLPVSAQGRVVLRPEGNTNLYDLPSVAEWVGLDRLLLKHEGENPTGSFKDRGMTVGMTVARLLGAHAVACASTGNTAASMASYAALAGMRAIVFIPEGKIAFGKLSQALAFGALTIQIGGDFDAAMKLVEQLCLDRGIYLLNSVNPFRIEGQKAIGFEILQDLGWEVPDWIVLPGGNLGNCSALAKGLLELRALGLIPRVPRIAVIQAEGADPFYRLYRQGGQLQPVQAETLATAIRIGDPVSWRKALRGVIASDGLVEEVSDAEILEAKARVDRAGIGAEPASCATVAGIRKLRACGTIGREERVVGILTGHVLKDPDTTMGYHRGTLPDYVPSMPNAPVRLEASEDPESLLRSIRALARSEQV